MVIKIILKTFVYSATKWENEQTLAAFELMGGTGSHLRL